MANTPQISVASSSVAVFSEGAISLAKPTGLAEGDLMLLFLSFASTNTVATPSGWSVVSNNSTTWGLDIDISVFRKTATAGDVAASTFSFDVDDGTGDLSGVLSRVTGVNPSATIGVDDIGQDTSTGTSRSHTVAFTPDQSDSLLFMAMGSRTGGTSVSSVSSTGSPTWTEIHDTERSSTSSVFYVGYAPYDSTTEITTIDATLASSAQRTDTFMFEVRTQVDATETATVFLTSPTIPTPSSGATAVGTHTLLVVDSVFFAQTNVATTPSVWTNTARPSLSQTEQNAVGMDGTNRVYMDGSNKIYRPASERDWVNQTRT